MSDEARNLPPASIPEWIHHPMPPVDGDTEPVTPQPGDALPESDPTDDLGNPLGEDSLRQALHDLANLQTANLLLRDLNERRAARISALESANERLRDQLDLVRRDLATANTRLAQFENTPSTRADIVALADRVAALEDVTYPQFELVTEAGPARVEVWTLYQNMATPEKRKEADDQLASALNAGWSSLHIALDTGVYPGGDAWTYRVVTLQREARAEVAPDPDAEQAEPDTTPDPEPAHAVDIPPLPRPFPGHPVPSFSNAADRQIVGVTPLPSIEVLS